MALIGIDLGTTNSALAYLKSNPEIIQIEGFSTMPSAIGYIEDKGEIVVGRGAKGSPGKHKTIFSVKADMGTDATFSVGPDKYKAHEISALYLKKIVEAAQERLEEPIDGAVITTPAYFGDPQNRATMKAAEEAGIKNVQLLAEPLAAALAFGLDNDNDVILVFDLGGGTFDVSVIDCFDFQMKGLAGNNRLGGDDFDNRLIDYLVDEIKSTQDVDIRDDREAMATAKDICEKAKITLSSDDSATLNFMCAIDGKPVMYMGEITQLQFEEMIEDLVESTIEMTKKAIANCQEDDEGFSKEDINRVILVGGSTYVPLVQKRVHEFFGMEPSKRVDPDLAVALGAAVKTATMQEKSESRGQIRVQLDPVPDVTNRTTLTIKGRTTPGMQVALTNGPTSRQCVADDKGKFSAEIDLQEDRVNTIIAKVESNGETRKAEVDIRHDSGFTGSEQVPRTKEAGVVVGKTARPFGIRLKYDFFREIIPANRTMPCQETGDGLVVETGGAGGSVKIIVCAGFCPCALFNTIIGEAALSIPPTSESALDVDIILRVGEDSMVFLEASLPDYPDRMVKASFESKETTRDDLDLMERVENFLTTYGNQIKPEEKSSLMEPLAALKDMTESFSPGDDGQSPAYQRILDVGNRLKLLISDFETRYQHGHS